MIRKNYYLKKRLGFIVLKIFLAFFLVFIILGVFLVFGNQIHQYRHNFDKFYETINNYEHFEVEIKKSNYLNEIYVKDDIYYSYNEEDRNIKLNIDGNEISYQLEEGYTLNPYGYVCRIFDKDNYLYFAINDNNNSKIIKYDYLTNTNLVIYERNIEDETITYIFKNQFDEELYYCVVNKEKTCIFKIESNDNLIYVNEYDNSYEFVKFFDNNKNVITDEDNCDYVNFQHVLYADKLVEYHISRDMYSITPTNAYIYVQMIDYDEDGEHIEHIELDSDLDIYCGSLDSYGSCIYFVIFSEKTIGKKESYTCLVKYDTLEHKFYTCLLDIDKTVRWSYVFENRLLLQTRDNPIMGEYYIEL